MNRLKPAAAIAAVIAAIGKVLDCGTEAATRLLMRTGLDYGRAAARAPLVCGLVLSIIGTVYLTFLSRNLWQLWLLAIPSLLLVSLGARIYRSAQKH